MKALSILFALCVCLSNGEPWTWRPEIYSNIAIKPRDYIYGSWDRRINPYFLEKPSDGEFAPPFIPRRLRPNWYNNFGAQEVVASRWRSQANSHNDNENLQANVERTDGIVNLLSNAVDKNYARNEVLRNNGIQKGLTLTSRSSLDPKQVATSRLENQANSHSDNKNVEANAKKTEDNVNLFSNPTDERYVGNEVLRNNGIQNDLTLTNVKNSNYPVSGVTSTSTLKDNLNSQADSLGNNAGSSRWVNANNNNNVIDSVSSPHSPSWYDRINTLPLDPRDILSPSSGIFYSGNDLYQPNQNQNECDNISDVLADLRHLLKTNDISTENHSLHALFSIIRVFIVNNHLQRASFDLIVGEMGKALLNVNNDDNNLRDDDLTQIVQQFRSRELNNFLIEIRSHRETSLHVVVSKLALLLSRLKQDLMYKRYSHESISIVINKLVQWTVPVLGYYFEKECKIKTQQYILHNLQVALNVNLDSIKNVDGLNILDTESQLGGLHNTGNLENLGRLDDLGSLGFVGNLESIGNLGVLENLQYPGNLEGTGYQGNLEVLGLGVPGNQGYRGNHALAKPGDVSELRNLINPLRRGDRRFLVS